MAIAAGQSANVTVRWEKIVRTSQTTPTLQVVVNPPLRRGTAIHPDSIFKALHDLQGDYVRYVPWLPLSEVRSRRTRSSSQRENFHGISP